MKSSSTSSTIRSAEASSQPLNSLGRNLPLGNCWPPVKAAGVRHWDALVREGKLQTPLPLILGYELSGIVEAIGAEVSGFKTGDEPNSDGESTMDGIGEVQLGLSTTRSGDRFPVCRVQYYQWLARLRGGL